MILSRNIFALLAIFAAPLPLCLATPGWYEAYDGKRYLIEPDFKYNWLQAYDQCRRRGLQLIDVNSAVKNEVLISLLRNIFGNSASQISLWIGLHDEFNSELDQNRLFNSVATGDQATFFSWDTNEPNNYNKEEHCVHIRGDHDFQWNDSNCKTLVTGFICEDTASVNTCPTQGNSNGNYEFEFEVTLNNSGVINVNTLVLNDRMLMNFQNSTDVAVAHLKGSIEEILQQKHELERKLGDVMYSLKNIIFSGQANFTSVNP